MAKLVYDDVKKLASQVKDLFLEDQSLKENLFVTWLQAIHFLNGQQALEWDQFQRRFRNIPLINRRSARPHIYTTNEIEPIMRTMVSFLTRHKPTAICYPNDPNDDESVRKAKIAEMVQKGTWDIDHEYQKYVTASYWGLTLGTVFRKDYWDSTARGQIHFPEQERDEMNESPQEEAEEMAQMSPPREMIEEMSEEDRLLMSSPQPKNWGDLAASILTPMNVAVDFKTTNFEDADWVMEYSLQQVDWVKEQFNHDAEGFTRRLGDVKAEESFGRALDMDLEMRFQTHQNTGKKPRMEKVCVLMEFYQAPRRDMPWNQMSPNKQRGRSIIGTRDVVLYDGPSFYDWHPYSCFKYEPFLGRFWGKGMVEQLITPQRRLNEINGAILENSQTMANPQWLVPDNTVREGIISGKHGLIVPWTPQPHGQVPTKLAGVPLPNQYFAERNGLIETMARIAGSNAVLSGVPPTGITAAAALQLLLENAQSQHGPLINQWELFVEQSQTKKLQNFQKFCREPRDDIVKYLKRIDKDLVSLDIDAICGDDIEDNVNVAIEAGSSIPRSQAARQAQMIEFAKMGLFDLQDPITKQQFLKIFGVTEFDKINNSELSKIEWENGRMLKGENPSPSDNDIHELHLPQHIAMTQRPSYIEDATQQARMQAESHIQWHQQQMQMKQQQAMEAQAMAGPQGPEAQGPQVMPSPTQSLPPPMVQ